MLIHFLNFKGKKFLKGMPVYSNNCYPYYLILKNILHTNRLIAYFVCYVLEQLRRLLKEGRKRHFHGNEKNTLKVFSSFLVNQ